MADLSQTGSTRIPGCWGWKGPGNHLTHLVHFTAEAWRLMATPLEARPGLEHSLQTPASVPWLDLSLLLDFLRSHLLLQPEVGEALSPEAGWLAISGNLCLHSLPRSFCRVAARDQVAWRKI